MKLVVSVLSLAFLACAKASPTGGSTLNWVPCDLDPNAIEVTFPIYCANLTVPLDYTGQYSNANLQLNLIRVNHTEEPFKGSVLTNPGGPGQSGVEDIASNGQLYSQ